MPLIENFLNNRYTERQNRKTLHILKSNFSNQGDGGGRFVLSQEVQDLLKESKVTLAMWEDKEVKSNLEMYIANNLGQLDLMGAHYDPEEIKMQPNRNFVIISAEFEAIKQSRRSIVDLFEGCTNIILEQIVSIINQREPRQQSTGESSPVKLLKSTILEIEEYKNCLQKLFGFSVFPELPQ